MNFLKIISAIGCLLLAIPPSLAQVTIPIEDGGTGASTAANARANLGLGSEAPTGTGGTVRAISPALVTPDIGAATGTSLALSGNLSGGGTFVQGIASLSGSMIGGFKPTGGVQISVHSEPGATNYATAGVDTTTHGASKFAGYGINGRGIWALSSNNNSYISTNVGGSIEFGSFAANPFVNLPASAAFTSYGTWSSTGITAIGDLTITGGNVGIGAASSTAQGLRVASSDLTGIGQYGAAIQPIFTTAATASGNGVYVELATTASTTMDDLRSIYVRTPVVGATNTITNSKGIIVANQGAAGVANSVGIDIEAQSGAAISNIGFRNAGLTSLTNPTEATTAGVGSLATSGGIYAGKKIIAAGGVTTFSTTGAAHAVFLADAQGGGQAQLELRAGSGATNRASRVDFYNTVSSAVVPRWTLINDYNQNGTNDFRLTRDGANTSITVSQTDAVTLAGALAVNGTGATTLGGSGATVALAGTSAVKGIRTATASLDFPSTAAGGRETLTVVVTGAAVGDSVTVQRTDGTVMTNAGFLTAQVIAADTVNVAYRNTTGTADDPAAFGVRVTVISF